MHNVTLKVDLAPDEAAALADYLRHLAWDDIERKVETFDLVSPCSDAIAAIRRALKFAMIPLFLQDPP